MDACKQALGRLRKEDCQEFKASLVGIVSTQLGSTSQKSGSQEKRAKQPTQNPIENKIK